jgi:hypothetical protein
MSGPLLVVVTLIYLYVGGELLWSGDIGMGIAYLGYAAANVGLIMTLTSH